jgi:thiamine-monophosphate kinase
LPLDDSRRQAATAPGLIAAHLRPEARLDVAPLLVRHRASAAMDLSDGLFGDLPKLLAASGAGARIELSALPVASAVRALFPDRWLELATRGGEDYELLFTMAPADFDRLRTDAEAAGVTVTAIGVTQDGPARITAIDAGGIETEVEPGAFDHFRS